VKGVGKPFAQRYRLARFGRGGFVRLALRTGAPIVPCAVVGAEEVHPKVASADWLGRAVGLPYLPITPTFPWLGPLGFVPLPTKWSIDFADPLPDGPMKLTRRVSSGSARSATKRIDGPSNAPTGVTPSTLGVVLDPPMGTAGGLSRGERSAAARASGCCTAITLRAPQVQHARSGPRRVAMSASAARQHASSTPSQSPSPGGTHEAGRSRIS